MLKTGKDRSVNNTSISESLLFRKRKLTEDSGIRSEEGRSRDICLVSCMLYSTSMTL